MPATRNRHVGAALFALSLGGFTIGTTEFATMGLLPQIGADLAASDPVVGHAITGYALGVVVGAPLLTVAAARLSRRRLLLWLMGAYTLANVLSAAAPSVELLVAGRFLAGLPHGAFFGVGAAVGAAVAGPGRRGHAVSMMMTGLTVANVVGVPLSTFVGQQLGWRVAFLLIGVLGAATLAGLLAFVPQDGPVQSSVAQELRSLRNRPLWISFAAVSIGFGGMFAVYSYVAPTVTRVSGLDPRHVPWVLAVFGVGMTVGTLLGGRLADRHVLRTMIGGFVATGLALVLFAVVGHWVVPAVVALFLLGVTSQVLGLATQTRLMDLSPRAQSLGAALCHSALNVGNAAGAFFGGLVIAAGWGYLAPAWTGVVLTAVGLALVLAFGRQRVEHRFLQ
ncbi:major facilitator superfamily MFS_1 [Xylanimonas cellulosilytica DSM 15894]|uniref:Major facilitator superfamily MFS_1 n=1 Tax=Xylanimonas cellulosilytica (strain DSM 15894 / JCM 12276 / CECT 5975 / KCTC 9989 / LMG 20990 / NBRC 107835 / XIL07) TaxID=446471 RepID=D1BV04_XYLCX|nr:MFS transporter [Xylanimonas cellulosilytica]ACZ31243.1 major facilitator superfamily MFS_1 [Xylanimonas cellulosilytica DSM 15894]